MSAVTIASRLIALCTAGEFIQAQQELYHPDIVSIDPDGSKTIGATNMHAKEQRFLDNLNSIISVHFSEPQFAGSYFTTILTMEIDIKNVGPRRFSEVCVYQTENDKIVFEQFFRDLKPVAG
ncbi:SnoaL-like domain-containing protein [Chitinophaga vietnamensis]|uniref:SnoaL-like domain-containing protein n=1 Tax=Chitinophaga vietnamensis TaxID=2593957 RepID=UPI00117838D3|nr:SnoaL-like domain-containing protein [Chitinophaga vietnamensis]